MMPVPWMTMALRGVSAIAFAWYGGTLLGKQTMVPEFESYGMARFRTLTGVLQLAGSAGLVLGGWYRPLLLLSAAGLALMMVVAVVVRVRCGDKMVDMVPAAALCALNSYIVVTA